ncbi:hypothetical protein DFJ58DRAFT_794723 [Suillus subalutaceus]|uniref:uncharacterized protein n=1 Tax=Suillus subalutaceus TaxID=48586 RepID=UPI001B87CD11|nr:uncharacterized protein DFJ58DRAFT_794723 [Suillus subalutaceus]KAG1849666.1 hypothetical protein DFJ58DRAFT_794723 [Suillus subalutaceus]
MRGYVSGVLARAALAEGYVLVSVSAALLPKDGTRIHVARQSLLPSLNPYPGPPSMSLAPALAHLERSIPCAHLLKYTRAAVMRNPELRETRSKMLGREDEAVQRAVLGMRLRIADAEVGEEGKLRMSARMAIEVF